MPRRGNIVKNINVSIGLQAAPKIGHIRQAADNMRGMPWKQGIESINKKAGGTPTFLAF